MILYSCTGGIAGRTRELRDLVQLEDIHVILLDEMKNVTPTRVAGSQLRVLPPRRNLRRGMAYRGTTVLVRRDIMHETEEPTSYVSKSMIGIKVGSADEEIRLFAAYRFPGTHRISPSPTLIASDLTP
ncbi:hypothetical protein EVAR_67099_1 [Eumeta japonica]|uniref:Uncharacterized protein n=1 Tax=Eumeta variegata TaxID=151549 RepID=A0A4C1ZUJ9_EUMVA|nr:hypothetical protein EVAR_67099_1 [Eumeta japonica]